MERGWYIGTILMYSLSDLVFEKHNGQHPLVHGIFGDTGGVSNSSGGTRPEVSDDGMGGESVSGTGQGGVGVTGGGAIMWVRCKSQLPVLSLWESKKSCTLLAVMVLPTFQRQVLCNNLHLCGLLWYYCKYKNLQIPTSPDLAETQTRLFKKAWG